MNIVYRIQLFAVALFSLFLVNCAKSGGSADPAGSCQAGNTYTQAYGCVPSCGPGLVYINGQCVSTAQLGGGTGSIGTSCGNNMILSVYGCLPQCGAGMVSYNGQCVPAAGNSGGGIIPPIGGGGQSQNICQGSCPVGQVQMSGGQCLPQMTCGACYGFANGWCYQGANARYYYGF